MGRGLRWLLLVLTAGLAVAQSAFQILHAQSAADTVVGGKPIRVIVQLTAPAPRAGQLPVSTDHPELCQTVPVLVAAGQSGLRFAVPTRTVDTTTEVTISVGFYGNVRDLRVVLQPDGPVVSQIRMPARMTSGDSGSVLIVLERASPRSARLSLLGNENVSIASSISIPPGVRQFEAPFSTKLLRQGGKGTLTYRGPRLLMAESQLLPPVEVSELQFTPGQIEGGQSGTGSVSLKAPAGAPARVKLSGPANLRLPADVTVAENAASAQFTFSAAPTRVDQNCSVAAATPLGQRTARLLVTPTPSLAATEAAQYFVMASSQEGWMMVTDSAGKKWRFKPGGAPRLGQLEPFGYLATLQGEGFREADSSSHRLLVQLRITGSKENWKVTEVNLLQVDGR